MGPPQIAIVGATPDSKVGDLPQQHRALLAPPGSTPMRESRNKAGRKSSRTARKHSPQSQPSQQALPIRQTPSQLQSQSQAPIPLMYAPSSSSPLAMEVENGEFSPPPLPIPSSRTRRRKVWKREWTRSCLLALMATKGMKRHGVPIPSPPSRPVPCRLLLGHTGSLVRLATMQWYRRYW